MSRDDGGGGGLWLLAGLGLAGLVGGGYAVARSRHPKAKPAAERGAELAELAAGADADAVAAPAPVKPAPSASASAAAQSPAPSASAPAAAQSPAPVKPAASSAAPASPAAPFVPPFRRWTGPIVPPVPADAPRGKLTRSTVHRGVIRESPAVLLEQARAAARDPRVSLDELAGARLAASEHGNGSLVELAAIVDAEVSRAAKAGRSLFDSLTRGAGFGRQGQGSKRPASTRLDPDFVHLWAARAVLVGYARGIARGAVAFFNPEGMDRTHAAWKTGRGSIPTSCDATGLLELWSFDRPRLGDSACPFDASKVGRETRAWVGAIEGVDPWRLMLMAPADTGPAHFGAYVAARRVIEEGRARAGQKAIV